MRHAGALALLAAIFAAGAVASGSAIHPILVSRTPLIRVAADGERVAWISGSCFTVRVRELAARRSVKLGNANAAECGPDKGPTLALGGKRAVWVVEFSGNDTYADVMTGTPGERERRVAEVEGSSTSPDGDYVTDLSGDQKVLVYAVIHMTMLDTCIDPGTPCEYYIASGRVRQVIGHTPRLVPHVPPALAISAQGTRIAVMVAAYNATRGRRPTGTIEVRNVGDGSLVSRAVASGKPLDVALGPSILAVLTDDGGQRSIERFAVPSGRAAGTTSVASDATNLGIWARSIVYRSRSRIYVVDASTGKRRLAAVARSRPIGMTIEDNRILWAENSRRGNRLVWTPAR